MAGFPDLDAVERYVHSGTTYEPPKTNIPMPPHEMPAPQQQFIAPEVQAIPIGEAPATAPIATVMLSDTQFERLLATTANPSPALVPQMAALPMAAAVNTEFGAVAPNGAGNGINNNIADTLGNITFGTVNRTGKAVTGLVGNVSKTFIGLLDNVIDIVTFGYGMKK